MLVSATVGFCTSDPPGRIPYSRTLPYCVLLTSVIFSIAGLIVGVSCAFIINRSSSKWVREVRYPSVLDCRDGMRCTVYYHLSSAVLLVEDTDRDAKQYLAGSRPRIWATMFMLSFPFIAVAVAATSAAAGECSRKGLMICSGTGTELRRFKSFAHRHLLFG